MEGRYTDAYLAQLGADAPKFTPEDLKIISSPVDFVGLNVYMPDHYVMAADNAAGYTLPPLPAIVSAHGFALAEDSAPRRCTGRRAMSPSCGT